MALVLVALGIKLLLWAIDNGQYDDLDKEAWRILADDQASTNKSDKAQENSDD